MGEEKKKIKDSDKKPEEIQEGEIVDQPSENKEAPENPIDEAPEQESTKPVVDTAPLLAEIEKLWKENAFLEKKVEFISNTNWLIVVVLFVGFLVLLFSLLTVYIESNNTAAETQTEFIKSIEELKSNVDELNSKFSTLTPTPIEKVSPSIKPSSN